MRSASVSCGTVTDVVVESGGTQTRSDFEFGSSSSDQETMEEGAVGPSVRGAIGAVISEGESVGMSVGGESTVTSLGVRPGTLNGFKNHVIYCFHHCTCLSRLYVNFK